MLLQPHISNWLSGGGWGLSHSSLLYLFQNLSGCSCPAVLQGDGRVKVMVIYRGCERCYKAQTELRVFLKTGNCCRQGLSLVLFNPLPPQMSLSTSPYFCTFSVFFSLSYRSLWSPFSLYALLLYRTFLALLLDPTPSLQIPFFLLQTLLFLPFSYSALLALAQSNWDCFSEHCTIPLSPWLSVSSSGNIPAPLQVSNCCHCN